MAKKRTTRKARATGRPSTYTKATADAILARLENGESLRSICRDESMPPESTVRMWANDDRDDFQSRFRTARDAGYAMLLDELLEIADDASGDVQRDRLRVDTRKWMLAKALPKVYGDRLTLAGEGQNMKLYIDVGDCDV